jgi:hypothetical protein
MVKKNPNKEAQLVLQGITPMESLNNPTSEATVVGTLSLPTKTDGEKEKSTCKSWISYTR